MEKKKDVLNREEFVNTITKFVHTLSDLKRGCSFAIDGKWGNGKTFLLEMLEDRLREQQSETTADNQYFLFHYNCWQYDYYEEPAVAMVSSLLGAVKEEEKVFGGTIDGPVQASWVIAKEEVKKMAGKFVENRIGFNLIDTIDAVKKKETKLEEEEKSFDKLFAFKETLDYTRESLKKIAEQKTLIFVVDELDRCIPSYAIKVLERLHHLFSDLDNVIVIIAVDGVQLEHSVKEIYGEKICVKEYLKKFINFTFQLDTGELSKGIFEKYHDYFRLFFEPSEKEKKIIESFFSVIWDNVDIRSQEQAMEKIRTVHKLLTEEKTDLSLALFEIMKVRFQSVEEQNFWRELAILSILERTQVFSLDGYLRQSQYDYFLYISNKMQEYVIKKSDGVNLLCLRKEMLGRFFEIIGKVYEVERIAYSDGIKMLSDIAMEADKLIDMLG